VIPLHPNIPGLSMKLQRCTQELPCGGRPLPAGGTLSWAGWGHPPADAQEQPTGREASRAGNPDEHLLQARAEAVGAPPKRRTSNLSFRLASIIDDIGSKARERDAPGGRQEALPSGGSPPVKAGSGTVLASGRSVAEALQEATRAALRAKSKKRAGTGTNAEQAASHHLSPS